MSTNREGQLVNVLSRWLAGHADDDELRETLEAIDAETLPAEAGRAVDELRVQLESQNGRADLQRVVRETLEVLSFGA
jgi:hypothetical protein